MPCEPYSPIPQCWQVRFECHHCTDTVGTITENSEAEAISSLRRVKAALGSQHEIVATVMHWVMDPMTGRPFRVA